jgi:protein-tyrosine phosphatase
MTIEQTTKGFYETLALNVQKGDTFVIRFKNDPTVYVGVPMLDLTAPDERFAFQILEPAAKKGLVSRTIDSIDLMDRV